MVHYFYVGHFEQDGKWVRLRKDSTSGILRPVVTHSVNPEVIRQALTDITGDPDFVIPKSWAVWFQDGYVSCDPYTHEPKAIELVAAIAKRDNCEICRDFFQPASIDDLVYSWPQEQPVEVEHI